MRPWISVVSGILMAGTLWAAQRPDLPVVWPAEWTVFGPVPSAHRAWPAQKPDRTDFVSGDRLKTIPGELEIEGKRYPGRRATPENGVIDLAHKTGPGSPTDIAYLMAPVSAAADTTVELAAGAGWFMQWWLDGQPVFDTLGRGNSSFPAEPGDFVFPLALSKGEHVVAVAVAGTLLANMIHRIPLRLAFSGPRKPGSTTFREAFEAGRRKLRRIARAFPTDFAGACADFQRAREAATTDVERADACLAMGGACLDDALYKGAPSEIRDYYAAAAACPGATPIQKAKAAFGLAEAWLREDRCGPARDALAAAADPGAWTNESDTIRLNWAAKVQFAVFQSYIQEKNDGAARAALERMPSLAGVDPALRFRVQSHLLALGLAPRIRPDHPRLFFNADTWPAVKARADADTNAFQALQRRVAFLTRPETFEPKDWGSVLMQAAFVYRVTGDAALLEKIRTMLRATTDYYLAGHGQSGGYLSPLGCLAALDWVWHELPPAEREVLADGLIRYAYNTYTVRLLTGRPSDWRWSYNYQPQILWYVGLGLLDRNGDGPDYSRAMALLGYGASASYGGYDIDTQEAFPRYLCITRGGGARLNTLGYAAGWHCDGFWTFFYCWESALSEPVPLEWAPLAIGPEYALRAVLGIRQSVHPDRDDPTLAPYIREFNFSRAWNPKDGWYRIGCKIYEHLGHYLHFFGRRLPEEAAVAGLLRQRLAAEGGRYPGELPIYPFLMDGDGAPPPGLLEYLPLARLYPGNGVVLMGSGFEPDSTRALFCCGSGDPGEKRSFPSEHFDSGHFSIYKQGYLALDSGTRAQHQSDYAAGLNYEFQTVAHNMVLIHMPDEKQTTYAFEYFNHGGQCRRPNAAQPLAFETDPHFVYVATDAAATYHPDKCGWMTRQFLFLAPDHFVVFDRVSSKRADYAKAWLLHAGNEPLIAGREFRADQDQGRLFCRTLLPADAVLEKIGGPGREFWAGERNWKISDDSPYLRDIGITNAADVGENMGRWRVEVKPGAARTDDVFLHLIQVSGQTTEQMVDCRLGEEGGQAVLTFDAGARSYTVRLNQAGSIGGHIRIEEGGQRVVDKDLTAAYPEFILDGFLEAALSAGQGQAIPGIMRVYACLPQENYRVELETGMQSELAIRSLSKDGRAWLYAANPGNRTVTGTIAVEAGGPVLDLASGRAVLGGGPAKLKVHLEPFGLAAWRVESSRLTVRSYQTDLSNGASP